MYFENKRKTTGAQTDNLAFLRHSNKSCFVCNLKMLTKSYGGASSVFLTRNRRGRPSTEVEKLVYSPTYGGRKIHETIGSNYPRM